MQGKKNVTWQCSCGPEDHILERITPQEAAMGHRLSKKAKGNSCSGCNVHFETITAPEKPDLMEIRMHEHRHGNHGKEATADDRKQAPHLTEKTRSDTTS